MPKIIVGFCKKVGEANFGSRGGHVAFELEVDGLTIDAERVKSQIAGLFSLARQAVDTELTQTESSSGSTAVPQWCRKSLLPINQNGYDQHRTVTPKQVKAIYALANRGKLDVGQLLSTRFNVNKITELHFTQASTLIDELKHQVSDGTTS
jgi:hypothetical protein